MNAAPKTAFMGVSSDLHLVERFTRISANTLQYDATMTDPMTWTRPWTARMLFKRTDEPLLEHACHEGNARVLALPDLEHAKTAVRTLLS